jgi:hypothetical protein
VNVWNLLTLGETKTALRQMRKDELVEFTWNLVQHYNEATRRIEDLQMMKDSLEVILRQQTLIRQGFPDTEQVG